MGRGRRPYAMQKGHLTSEEQTRLKDAEESITIGREQLAKPPSWLTDATAKREFKRIVFELNKIQLVGNLDISNLGGYCNAYSMYCKATKELKSSTLTVAKTLKDGTETIAENPLINIQRKYAEEMRKFASLCGMTIDSRLKAAVVNIQREDNEIEDEFGDI